ncbi:hypothetical protein [Sharpea azabuensis]|uniref:Uncharacterized protein n=1 Tax=Sharpea azabuensis TaxID=322505 RepID=A0A1H6XBC1_9FIRM|nr:hypothetical protein [Sharpea azabuensis]SEJ24764.1 hypothetical protein SAMN04487834_10836 [Sharpea azabuensis]
MDLERIKMKLEKDFQDIQKYVNIMNKIATVNFAKDLDFQKEFNSYYKINRNAEWRKYYYQIFEDNKSNGQVSFDNIIGELYKKTGRIEPSLVSKMLASINPHMPIWDSKFFHQIGITPPRNKGDEKLKETINLYKKIAIWYDDTISKNEEIIEYIKIFNDIYPQFSFISEVKKIDYILRAMEDETEDITTTHSWNQNSNYRQALENWKKIVNSINERNKLYIADILPKFKLNMENTSKTISLLHQNMLPAINFQQQIINSILPVFKEVSKLIKNIQTKIIKIELPESILRTLGDIRYLILLNEIQWPLFLVDDDEIKKMITSMCNTDEKNYPLNELSSKICKQFTENKLDSIGNSWKTKCSNKDLLLILKEAIKLHKEGYYFGSTSLLMCQVSGLIKEISKYAIDNNLEINKDDEMTACKLLNVEYNDHIKRIEKNKNRASERHLMLRLMVYPKKGEFYWYAVTEYIYNIIFTNKDGIYEDHNPLRNKICHGVNLTFGTEEKSLKSILVIDLLLNLQADLKWMVSKPDKNVEKSTDKN